MLAHTARWAAEAGDAPAAIDDDMPAFGKAYAALTEDEWMFCHALAENRHRALNWLCGYAERWDDVPLDT